MGIESVKKATIEFFSKFKKALEPKYTVTWPDGFDGVNIQEGITRKEAYEIQKKHTDVKIYPQ